MWISNTATTAMMIPIVEAVLQQLKRHLVVGQEPFVTEREYQVLGYVDYCKGYIMACP